MLLDYREGDTSAETKSLSIFWIVIEEHVIFKKVKEEKFTFKVTYVGSNTRWKEMCRLGSDYKTLED